MTTSFMNVPSLRTWWPKPRAHPGRRTARRATGAGGLTIVVPSLHVGGTERQVVELALGLHEAGTTPIVVLLDANGELLADLNAAGIEVAGLAGAGALRVPANMLALHRLVRERGVSTLYTFLSPANFTASLQRVVTRRLDVVWGIRDDRVGAERGGVGRIAARLLTRALVRNARGVIVNGSSVRDALVRFGVPTERVRVVPNSIDQSRFAPSASARSQARHELGIAADTPVVLSLARLAPKKRHADVIDAFAIVAAAVDDAVLLVAGGGEADYVASLHTRVDERGLGERVRFLGERRDADRLFNAADVTLLLSEAEGFPNSVAESLAAGTPCVATRVGDIPALVPDHDIVAVGDVPAAAAAVQRHLRSPATPRVCLLPPGYGREQLVVNTLDALRSLGCRFGDDDIRARAEDASRSVASGN